MFASIVSNDRCELYYVEVHDRIEGTKYPLRAYPCSDFATASRRAEFYRSNFDPERFGYRVAMAS